MSINTATASSRSRAASRWVSWAVRGSGSHARQTAALLVALEEAFESLRPALVVDYGDVNSTLAAALVAAKLHLPQAHVEAGLRSFDMSMPEEVNRRVADAFADLCFATSADAVDNLRREGVPAARIHLVGNSMIDSLEVDGKTTFRKS